MQAWAADETMNKPASYASSAEPYSDASRSMQGWTGGDITSAPASTRAAPKMPPAAAATVHGRPAPRQLLVPSAPAGAPFARSPAAPGVGSPAAESPAGSVRARRCILRASTIPNLKANVDAGNAAQGSNWAGEVTTEPAVIRKWSSMRNPSPMNSDAASDSSEQTRVVQASAAGTTPERSRSPADQAGQNAAEGAGASRAESSSAYPQPPATPAHIREMWANGGTARNTSFRSARRSCSDSDGPSTASKPAPKMYKSFRTLNPVKQFEGEAKAAHLQQQKGLAMAAGKLTQRVMPF
ncbi:unnamed protein product [Pedinophyceae sp. YPF-701]|nr:unnamed protein product [Pedinophyceae sp. YPF-701]